jgi:hypothetical protein
MHGAKKWWKTRLVDVAKSDVMRKRGFGGVEG